MVSVSGEVLNELTIGDKRLSKEACAWWSEERADATCCSSCGEEAIYDGSAMAEVVCARDCLDEAFSSTGLVALVELVVWAVGRVDGSTIAGIDLDVSVEAAVCHCGVGGCGCSVS